MSECNGCKGPCVCTPASAAQAEASPGPEQAITRDQATELVGKHMLVLLEDIIAAHEAVLSDLAKSATRAANARLVIAAAQAFGRPLYQIVKAAERPRILRPERSIRVVR